MFPVHDVVVAMTVRELLVLECEDLRSSVPALFQARGAMGSFFTDVAAGTTVARVWAGEAIPDAERLAGVIVSGSSAMVADRDPWIVATREWLATAADAGLPILGVCFGHQLLADMFGGTVTPMSDGPAYATVDVTLSDDGRRDPLMAGLPDCFPVQASHFQAVERSPTNARSIAHSPNVRFQALRFDERVWGIQFHPEFLVGDAAMIVRQVAPRLVEQGQQPETHIEALRPTPDAMRILHNFASLCTNERS